MRFALVSAIATISLLLPAGSQAKPGYGYPVTCSGAKGYLWVLNMTCQRAERIGHKFQKRAQLEGPRLRIEGFRCNAEEYTLRCHRGTRQRMKWELEP